MSTFTVKTINVKVAKNGWIITAAGIGGSQYAIGHTEKTYIAESLEDMVHIVGQVARGEEPMK